jgi:hypothetical protein
MESRTIGSRDIKEIHSGRVTGGIELNGLGTGGLAFGYFKPEQVENRDACNGPGISDVEGGGGGITMDKR